MACLPYLARMSWKVPDNFDVALVKPEPVHELRSVGLPRRLQMVAGMVPEGQPVVDIGTDHGRLPLALVRAGRATRVIAADVNEAPLMGAKRSIAQAGLSAEIETRLGDGFDVLQAGEATVATLAGMGGERMVEIVEARSPVELGIETLILQPNSHASEVRMMLWKQGWAVEDEQLCVDGGRIYLAMRACSASATLDELSLQEVLVGRSLPERGGALFRAWLVMLREHAMARLKGVRAGGCDLAEIALCEARLSLYEELMSKK